MAINRLIQGSLQSGLPKFDSVWDGRSAVGSMEPISAITLSAAQSSVEFNNIPGTYSHLQIRIFGRSSRTSSYSDDTKLNFNGDTGSNYSYQEIIGYPKSATSPTAGAVTSGTTIYCCRMGADPTNGSIFGLAIVDILDYANTNKYKTVRSINGVDCNDTTNSGAGMVQVQSGGWRNTSAITTIRLSPNVGTNFNQYSSFSLYGIK